MLVDTIKRSQAIHFSLNVKNFSILMFFFLIILLLLRDSFLIILLLLIDVWYHLVGLNLVSLRQLAYSQHLICSSSHLTMISQNICMIVSTLQLIYPSIWKNRKHRIEMPTKVRNKVGMCKLALGDPEICSVSNKWQPPLFCKHMKAPSMQLFLFGIMNPIILILS